MQRPVVSVIIPVFNGADDVSTAVDSVLAQDSDCEIIVVNDGSSDRTAEVLQEYGDRIRVITQSNQGLARTRNNGVRASRGEWIAFLDHDDQWLPDKITRQLAAASAERADLIFTNTQNFGDSDRVGALRHKPDAMPSGDLFPQLLMDNFLVTSSIMLRRSVFDAVGEFTESPILAEDWDLWLKLAAAGYRFAGLPEALTLYRWRAGSFSKNHERMRSYRELALRRALTTERGRCLPWSVRRRALAGVESSSAWFLAAASPRKAILWYAQSLCYWPFDLNSWKGMVKGCLGRS